MGFFRLFAVIAFLSLGTQGNAYAYDNGSLEHVAAIVADALATGDGVAMARHARTYEDVCTWGNRKKISQSAYQREFEKQKRQIGEHWKEVREAGLTVDHVKIHDVRTEIGERGGEKIYHIYAIVVPVFKIDGELAPVIMLRMFFVPCGGQWKYIYK